MNPRKAKNFGALRVKMASAARARAAQRAQAMLDEIPKQGIEAVSDERIREFEEDGKDLAKGISQQDGSKK
jgi:hypothetical protein